MKRQKNSVLFDVQSSTNRRHFLKVTTLGISGIALGTTFGIALPESVFANSEHRRPNDTVAFYRLFKGTTGDHFYTTSYDEAQNAEKNFGYKSEGIACYVYSYAADDTVPLYRLYKSSTQHHFYTTNEAEAKNAEQNGYTSEGTACYVYPTNSEQPPKDSVKFYRLYNSKVDDHFYTTNKAEADKATKSYGYKLEGIACYVYATDSKPYSVGKAKLYRLYRPSTQHHLYTTDDKEAEYARMHYGYKREGVACRVYPSNEKDINDTIAFYRLYNPKVDDHFYTTNKSEANYAVSHYGYTYEGVACYVYATNDYPYGSVPFYRLYKSGTGDHFYTTDSTEAANAVSKYGYKSEGVACYVFPA